MVAKSTTVTLGYQVQFGLTTWLSGKESVHQCRRYGFDLWVRKIPQRRKWQPTRVFMPEKNPTDHNPPDSSVHGVAQSQKWLSDWTHTRNLTRIILSKLGTFSFLSSNKGNPKGDSYYISGSTHSLRFLIFLTFSNV